MQKQIEDLIVKIKRRIRIKFTFCKGHLALRLEQSISHEVIANDDLNIAGTYYTLADGRIIRVFIGPSGKEMYSFVKGIPKPTVEEIERTYSDLGESTFESRHRVLGRKNPETSSGNKWLDEFQFWLDIGGFIPVWGFIPDLLNSSIYLARGDLTNAGWSTIGAVPFLGDGAKGVKVLKKGVDGTDNVIDAGKNVKDVKKSVVGNGKFINNADEVVFKQSSIDKAFSKHRKDFGNYPDGSKSSVELFKDDISKLINTGVQKQGKYRNVEGTHIYNENTKQWVFINSDGTLNTAFKLSDSQFEYLIKTGVVK